MAEDMTQDVTEEAELDDSDTASMPSTTAAEGQAETYTQDDLNKLLARERQKARRQREKALEAYADYDDLKTRAAKLDEIEDAQKSEQDRLLERMQKLEQDAANAIAQNARLEQERQAALVRADVTAQATRLNYLDPLDAYRLIDLDKIIGDEADDVSQAIQAQLEALAEAKPYLIRQASQATRQPAMSPANPPRGQQAGETRAEQRGRLFGAGESPIGSGQGGGVRMPDTKDIGTTFGR